MNTSNTVKFDPGYAPLVIDSIGQVGYNYYIFSAIREPKLKRINFPHTLRKLEGFLKDNICFYLGCLLWASYISSLKDKTIEGNKLLGEEAKEEEYTQEINFLISFLTNDLNRDCKYYTNKSYIPDERYIKILKAYKEFLIINDGFVNCSNTNQIVLPKELKALNNNSLETIKKTIDDAIENKNLEKLFECYELIF